MNQDDDHYSEWKPLGGWAIFCGVMRTHEDSWEKASGLPGIRPWQTHVHSDGSRPETFSAESCRASQDCIRQQEEYYYPGFVRCLIPAGETTGKRPHVGSFTLPLGQEHSFGDYSVQVDYIDLFFFPDNHLIYCFKCRYIDPDLGTIVALNEQIRNTRPGEIGFLAPILKAFCAGDCLNIGNKLKLFFCLSHDFTFTPEYTENHLLYDLATCASPGTAAGKGKQPDRKPSESYFTSLTECSRISVFENWTALCLFDTVTLLQRGAVYDFNWEFRYFRFLYVHSLFVKSYLSETSREFYLDTVDHDLEEAFFDFDKHYNFRHISYNFLPQMIYEKIREGLNIERELTDIREAIGRDSRKRRERREADEAKNEKRMNLVLFIIALLTVVEAVYHGTEWMFELSENHYGSGFGIGSVLALAALYFFIYYYFKLRKSRKRS
ncbi:MAG TPA: hypothetical protein PKG48_01800 [Bacteroidales bacterium]|nr:hypothetical protein [Bacteroidales bacterium]HPS61995.1 hypothetical protein [Bacteroidales bacterium]